MGGDLKERWVSSLGHGISGPTKEHIYYSLLRKHNTARVSQPHSWSGNKLGAPYILYQIRVWTNHNWVPWGLAWRWQVCGHVSGAAGTWFGARNVALSDWSYCGEIRWTSKVITPVPVRSLFVPCSFPVCAHDSFLGSVVKSTLVFQVLAIGFQLHRQNVVDHRIKSGFVSSSQWSWWIT